MRSVRRITLVAIVSALLLIAALGVYPHYLRSSAEKIFRVSHELSTRNHPPTLGDLRQQFGADLKQPDPCMASGCKYEVMLSNRALARIRLIPYTALSSSFWVKDDVVQENVAELWTVNREGRMIVAYVDAKYCKGRDGFDVIPCEGSIASLASGSVSIGSGSGLEEKRAAFAFNPSCLTTFRGCTTIADLAPALWHGSASGTVQCATAGRQ
jgi:hypothetical protein